MSDKALFIGIDLGTSGCRAIAIDAQRQVQGEARVNMPSPEQKGGGYQQDPEIWWQAVIKVLRLLLQQVPAEQVHAISVDATSSTVLLCDKNGKVNGPALMYNDARAIKESERMERIVPKSSAAHGPSSSLAKFLWLQRFLPQENIHHICHQADWIVGQFTGRFDRSDSNNCLKLGYDPIARQWPSWLGHVGLFNEWLPKVFVPGQPMGTINAVTAQRFGLNEYTQIVAGTTDSTAAFIATGACQIGEAVTSLGSTLVMKVVSALPISAPEYGVYSQPLGHLWLVGGGSNSGGSVLKSFFDDQQLTSLSEQIDPQKNSPLSYYPLLIKGERFPINDADLAPCMEPRPTEDSEFLHALLQGMSNIEKQAYKRLSELGAPYPQSIRSAGGGASNPQWSALRERLLGIEFIPAHSQEAAYGSALLALKGVTGESNND